MGSDSVVYERQGAIGIIKLNRPEKLNAVNFEMGKKLVAALRSAKDDEEARVVIIKGEGRAFSSGADLRDSASRKTCEDFLEMDNMWQDMARVINDLGKPIIALLQGWTVAGTLEMAMACDIRIAAEDTKLWWSEISFCDIICCANHQILARLCGPARAKEILFCGEPIDAKQAEAWGLVNHVVPPDKLEEAGLEMANRIAKNPAFGIKCARELIDNSYDLSVEGMLRAEMTAAGAAWATEENRKGKEQRIKEISKE